MRTPIAIVGRGCVLPGASSPDELCKKLSEGHDFLTRPPAGAWPIDSDFVTLDATGTRWPDRGGYVGGFTFDSSGFAIDPEELMEADRCTHWVLHAARAALSEAGYQQRRDHRRTGVVLGHLSLPLPAQAQLAVGIWLRKWAKTQGKPELARLVAPTLPAAFNRYMSALPTRFVGRALGLGAGAFTLDAACASSLYAIKLACDALADRRADLMLAGGVCGSDPMLLHIGFRAIKALSPTGQIRPFHKQANGLVLSEGAVILCLKRLVDAESAGDHILGVIRGIGLTNDGGATGLLVPSSQGQIRAMQQALDDAGISPKDVALLECHATGTPVGDSVELASISRVYEGCKDLPIGSLKGQLGHLLTASGAAALLKILAAFEADRLPPSLVIDEPIEALASAPLRLLTAEEPWPKAARRVAGINSFGFGGNNAHMLVEAYDGRRVGQLHSVSRPPHPLPLAVVGIGVISASAGNTQEFTNSLLSGSEALQAHPRLGRCGLANAFHLASHQIRFPPLDLAESQPQQVILLKAVEEALSGLRHLPSNRSGVLVGMECDPEISRHLARGMVPAWIQTWSKSLEVEIEEDWLDRMSDGFSTSWRAAAVTGSLPNIVANRLNAQLKLGGPGYSVSADELSGLRALEIAARALRVGELDTALVAAVDLCCETVTAHSASFLKGPGRNPPGDAAVALVIKRLADARRDKDTVLVVIDGEFQQAAPTKTPASQLLHIGDAEGALHLGSRYGHAHAASGLLHVAAAVVACHQGAWLTSGAANPWPASSSERRVCVNFQSQDGQTLVIELRSAEDQLAAESVDMDLGSLDQRVDFPTPSTSSGGSIRFEAHIPEITLPAWSHRQLSQPLKAGEPKSGSVSFPFLFSEKK